MGGFYVNNDWKTKKPSIQVQKIIQVGETLCVPLSLEMLEHLQVENGENVEVEMKEHELLIRKIFPPNSEENYSEKFFQTLNEEVEKYGTTMKSFKNR